MLRVTTRLMQLWLGLLALHLTMFAERAVAQDGPPHPDRTGEHAKLDPFTGDWSAKGQLYIGGEEIQTIDIKGTEKVRWMPGLLWLEIESQGNIGGALPFVGRTLCGYDVTKKKFVQTGVTSLSSSHLSIAEGSFDDNTKTLTTFDTSYEVGGRTPSEVRIERQLTGKDTQSLRVFTKKNGDWVKTLEMNYTRKAP